MTDQPILSVEGLSKIYGQRRGWFSSGGRGGFVAVDDVGFSVAPGETLGIVGESGSGKSTTARMLLRLVEPTSGSVHFDGQDLLALDADMLRRRRRGIQMIFQDPFSSLNPRLRIGAQIGEPLTIHGLARGAEARERVAALMATVGLDPARAGAYPHEFSGGQRQRITIARALASEPKLIVADEAVSALDVSVQAQILNLLDDLKRSTGMAMVFISHDLGVVRHLVDRTAVMHRGRIVEIAPTTSLFEQPRHPYTHALLEAIPGARPGRPRAPVSEALVEGAAGCAYAARCPLAVERCRRERPPLERHADNLSACFRAAEVMPLETGNAVLPDAAAMRLRHLQARFVDHAASGKGGVE